MTTLVRPTPSTYESRGWIEGSHRGIDYGHNYTEKSMEILAAAAGTVLDTYTDSGYNGGWGRRIRVAHDAFGAVVTTYNHIRPGGVLVSPGQAVTAGQLIARMGSSGAATGTHLHFELYLSGVRVDPQPYFTRDLPGTGSDAGTSSGAPAASGGQTFTVPTEGQYYYWQYQNALAGNYSRTQLLRGGQTLAVVENPGTGPVRVRCADGDLVWVGTRNNPAAVSGASAPAAKQAFVDLSEPWFYYESEADARAGRFTRGKTVPAGRHRIDGGSGPYLIYVGALGRQVWVGSKTLPSVVYL